MATSTRSFAPASNIRITATLEGVAGAKRVLRYLQSQAFWVEVTNLVYRRLNDGKAARWLKNQVPKQSGDLRGSVFIRRKGKLEILVGYEADYASDVFPVRRAGRRQFTSPANALRKKQFRARIRREVTRAFKQVFASVIRRYG